MPFVFPDPSVQTSVVNPDTGERWVYINGVWELSDDQTPDPCPTPAPSHSALEEAIEELQAEIVLLRSDIIELRTELSSVTNSNLILE